VRGSAEPLLKAIATSGATRVLSREPSLEELFLAQYGRKSEEEMPAAETSGN
jgi:ABC-2 type transport system ATP-binding protein